VTHLPFIVASYALGVVIPGWLAVSAWLRSRNAARRLDAMGKRAP